MFNSFPLKFLISYKTLNVYVFLLLSFLCYRDLFHKSRIGEEKIFFLPIFACH